MKQKDEKANKSISSNPVVNICHHIEPHIDEGKVVSVSYRKTIEYKDGTIESVTQDFNMRIIPFDASMNIISSCMTGQMYGNTK